jgi:Fe-S cluster biogenesis protein NfuA
MIYTEMTPNPASLKFVTGRVLIPKGSADFPEDASREDAPIVNKLYHFAFVKSVFIGRNFITITKTDEYQWEDVIPAVKDFLKNYFESGQPVLTGPYMVEDEVSIPGDEDETVVRIKELIDSHIRPAVAMDGGDIIYDSFEEGTVRLRMQGSCSGCPSSLITLKAGIEGLLTRMVPEVKRVEAV